DITTTVNQINSLDPIPQVVVLAGLEGDALRIISAYIAAHPNATTNPQIRWLTTATTKTPAFTADMPPTVFADLPATARPVAGSAPPSPVVGHAYRALERAYRDAYNDDVGLHAFAPNVWDSVYLLAAAFAKQSIAGDEPGGPGLRDALRAVASG